MVAHDLWQTLWSNMGFIHLTWQMVAMWGVSLVLFYLAIYKHFEPLLLVPIAFGALLANIPTEGVIDHPPGPVYSSVAGIVEKVTVAPGDPIRVGRRPIDADRPVVVVVRMDDGKLIEQHAPAEGKVGRILVQPGERVVAGQSLVEVASIGIGGLFYYFSQGIILEIFPPLIFLGVGALTDFGPLIANPRTLMLGGAAKLGISVAFLGAIAVGFIPKQAAAIGIIGGADGPITIYIANKLAPELLGAVAVAAYSYMALVPLIQPPIMRALTTPAERKIKMKSLRKVGRLERLVFILIITILCLLLAPPASALLSMLMLGNLLRESGCTPRLVGAAQNEIINIVTIFLGTCVGMTMNGDHFLTVETLKILVLGVFAFAFATAGGVLMAKLMNFFNPKDPINPLIGSAGVSAVPMAARVSQTEGQKADPTNYLLMHAMGPNVAGVIGTALVAGYFMAILGR